MEDGLSEIDIKNTLLACKYITSSLDANDVEEWTGIWAMHEIIQICFLKRDKGLEEYEELMKLGLETFKERWERR